MRRPPVALAALGAAVLATPGDAFAQQPTIALKVARGGSGPAVLAGDALRVTGTITPYVAGQKVTVRLYRGARKLRAVARTATPVGDGSTGRFRVRFTARRPGKLVVRASHRATPQMATAVAAPVPVEAIRGSIGPAARGATVRVLQRRLAALGYPVGQRGRFDARTARAVLAFRKVTGMRRTTGVSRGLLRRLLRGGGRFRVRYPRHGHHVEADLSRQVIALIDGARVRRIYLTSSGAPVSPTVRGSFRVYLKAPGTNAKGMVHSSYFTGAYAIHGYASVPVFPASHGCLRVPVPDAARIFDWLKLGDRVDVYR